MAAYEYEDLSPWAVHFTTPGPHPMLPEGQLDGYHNMMRILAEGRIRPVAEPHGAAKEIVELVEQHRPACFSEIPLHLLERLVENRSEYGIGFSQQLLLMKGGGRVWYLEDDSNPAEALRDLITERAKELNVGDPLWRLTPLIDFPSEEIPLSDYRWEREWRVPGGLVFTPDEVAFLFIPDDLHDQARQFFANAEAERLGPAYNCPYIDTGWDRDQIARKLADTPPLVKPTEEAVYRGLGLDRL